MKISEISELIRTQDNRITDQPMFVVQKEVFEYGLQEGFADDCEWFNNEYHEVADEEKSEELDELDAEGDTPDEWERVYYRKRWEFVTACFTEQGCKDYLAANGHNLGVTRIYAYGTHRNYEFQAVRQFLVDMESAS
ncbi:hypothetical protein [uncultured Paraglaciecola sp.]|uniref:hypothetical protein n=1 Tax=uncultured Paraglaciecola sp. TaxID=1765024 RepID=UPI002612DF4D|nr:hypothetical protein [uncultured Paraglaciecola sp.]